jgi:enediyne biosynthesis protein E5
MADTNWEASIRLGGLRRFAIAITVLNILGHIFFGFEQSYAQPFVALAAAYSTEFLLEWIGSRTSGRRPAYAGGWPAKVDFLLSAHISGLAVAMLLYSNERLWPTAFAAAAAIASKSIFRIPAGTGSRHLFNPSNFGITLTLLCFPWVGIAQPYMFTENLDRVGDWLLPAVIVCSGTFLNFRFTHRLPLIGAWLSTFALQALLRHLLLGASMRAALGPMTGVAFILYTFYMVTDPATTPKNWRLQIVFGASVAATYGLLMVSHIVFGLFFALSAVCTLRGLGIYLARLWALRRATAREFAMAAAQAQGD